MRILLLVLLITSAAAAQTCAPNATQQAAANALALQRQLLAASTPVMDTDVPLPLRPVLHNFKQALIATVDTELRCDHPEAVVLQSALVSLLHANAPPRPLVPEQGPPWPTTEVGDYGGELHIEVKAVPAQPNLYSIQITYDIECGTDNILLLYRHTPSGWQRELLWQNPDLNSVGDAFGDMYLFRFVPGSPSRPYLVTVVRGTPWCTSVMSVFHVDLLAPAHDGRPQERLDEVNQDFRIDEDPRLRVTTDGLELPLTADDLATAVLARPGIFRYRTLDGKLERVQPVAMNARDFVDAWLQAPWSDAERWSDGASFKELQEVHSLFSYKLHPNDALGMETYGPTRACTSTQNLYQVELNTSPQLYAKVRQNPNSFTMLSIAPHPDPACHGPDLMKGPSK